MADLKIIGAGLCRTGTQSMEKALSILGFNTVYNFYSVFESGRTDINPVDNWIKIFKEHDMEGLKEELKGYSAALDNPTAFYFKELMDISPNAKVILSVRDSAEQWENSMKRTVTSPGTEEKYNVLNTSGPDFFGEYWRVFKDLTGIEFDPRKPDADLKIMYNNWVDYVKQSVPPEKLLVFNPKDGWEPLCKFLQIPIPKESYPFRNTATEFKDHIKVLN